MDQAFINSTPLFDMGLGVDYIGNPIPSGLDMGTDAANQPPPPLSTTQAIWDNVKNDVLGGVQWIESEISSGVSSVYNVTKKAVGTVVKDVTSPITDAAKSTYTYLIVAVVVVGVVIYFAGKSGALRISR